MPSHAKPSRGRVVITATAAAGLIATVALWPAEAQQSSTSRPESCVLDSTSRCTLTHGQPSAPLVFVQERNRGQSATVDWVNDKEYRLSWLWHDGRGFKAGTEVKFYVDFQEAPSTPTPSVTPSVTPTTPTVSQTPTVTPTPTPTVTPTQPPGACDITNPAYKTSSANGSWIINPADPGGVQVNNNVWSPTTGWAQTLYACSATNWSVVANQPGTGTDDGVKSYPDTQYHVRMPVSQLTTLNSTWKVNTPSAGGAVPSRGKQWNAAYDLWIGDTATSRFDTEVMVWTNWTANWQYWYGQLNGEQVTFDGVSYSVYHRAGSSSQAAGIWFIRNTVTNSGSVDLAKLLKWAQAKGWMPATSVMHEVEYGFEVLYTGEPTRFDLLDFTLTTS
jgi:hypothetical protein